MVERSRKSICEAPFCMPMPRSQVCSHALADGSANVASIAGLQAIPPMSSYVVGKTALLRFSENLALETDADGLQVFPSILASFAPRQLTIFIISLRSRSVLRSRSSQAGPYR
jgi:hypothetical protein